MKKVLLSVLALAALAGVARAVDNDGPPPFLSTYGAAMQANSAVVLGRNAKEQSSIAIPCVAACAISAGEVVVLAGTTYPVSVSKTATAGSPAAFGVALTTVTAAGQAVQVAVGGVVRVKSSVNGVLGGLYITGATAGKVTAVAEVGETLFTPLSRTALVIRALETRTITSGDPTILGIVLN